MLIRTQDFVKLSLPKDFVKPSLPKRIFFPGTSLLFKADFYHVSLWKFRSTFPLYTLRDVDLCDRDFSIPICSIHKQAEFISTLNTLQSNFKSVDSQRSWVCTVLSFQWGQSMEGDEIPYRKHRYSSEACWLHAACGRFSRREFSPNGYLAQAEMKWKSDKAATLQGVKQCCRD